MVNERVIDVNAPAPDAARSVVQSLRARKINAAHFAFMRALVQGLDLRMSWERYLAIEGEFHPARVKRTVAWLRNEFALAARREGQHGAARLVLIDVSQIPMPVEVLPDLDAFAASKGLTEFTQKEQLDAYKKIYGGKLKDAQRRHRLIEKQLEKLREIETKLVQPPHAGDSLASWFNPYWVRYFEKFGLFTLRTLIDRINSVPHRWWTGIQGIGADKAARIEHWILSHELTLRIPISDAVYARHPEHRPIIRHIDAFGDHHEGGVPATRLVPRQTDVVPIDRLLVPSELDGTQGRFRAHHSPCLIDAKNDLEAILTWVKGKHGLTPDQKKRLRTRRNPDAVGDVVTGPWDWLNELSHTQRAYLREAERFYLWAIVEKKNALSSMTVEDCTAYRDFLADPRPEDRWCGKRNARRGTPAWRPFEGPLGLRAQNHTVSVLRNLFSFLVDQCYLAGNAWKGVEIPQRTGSKINVGRSFTMDQWDFIDKQLDDLPETSRNLRLKVVLRILYGTGLRLSEIVRARVNDLTWVEYPSDAHDPDAVQGWLLSVIGKGDKPRDVPVPEDVIEDLRNYLEHRGLQRQPAHVQNRDAYLIGMTTDLAARAAWAANSRALIDPKAGIAASTLYGELKTFFDECAKKLEKTDELGAQRLRAGSTHWMRHTHASHWIARGTPVEIAQQNLGHSSLATTTVYVTTEQKRRMKAIQGGWQKGRVPE